MEVLVSLVLLSLVAFNLAYSSVFSMKTFKRTLRHTLAAELAMEKMEELSATNPSSLDNNDDLQEPNVEAEGIRFSRATDITVNSDGSRTVTVTVTGDEQSLGGNATFSTTFALWELS